MRTSHEPLNRFLLLAGEAYIRSGASAASTTEALLAVCRHAGLEHATVSITLGQITLSSVSAESQQDRTIVQEIEVGSLDIWRRARVEEVVSEYLMDRLTLDGAIHALALQRRHARRERWWPSLLGFSVLGGGFSLILGGDLTATLGAMAVSVLVSSVFRWLDSTRAPAIFSYGAGGLIAVLASVLFALGAHTTEATVCIVSALAARLAGLTSYGAVQDAITGWYLTAVARIMEALVSTAGLVGGVSAGIGFSALLFGPRFRLVETLSAAQHSWWLAGLGAALVAGGFALSSGGTPVRVLSLLGLGAAAYLARLGLGDVGLDAYSSATIAAAAVGAVSVLLSKALKFSSNAIMTVGLLPLFPGLLLYQGMLGSLYRLPGSPDSLFEALTVAFCLSVGGTLGQYLLTEGLWSARMMQFRRQHPGQEFVRSETREANAHNVMLPVFRRPFSSSESS